MCDVRRAAPDTAAIRKIEAEEDRAREAAQQPADNIATATRTVRQLPVRGLVQVGLTGEEVQVTSHRHALELIPGLSPSVRHSSFQDRAPRFPSRFLSWAKRHEQSASAE